MSIITVRHQPAENLADTLRQSFPPSEATLLGKGDQLIVRGTPDTINAIESMVSALDRPLQQFLIEVAGSESRVESDRRLDTTLHLSSEGSRGKVVVENDRGASRGNHIQTIRALEGYPSTISTGTAIPVTSRTYHQGQVSTSTDFHAVDQGFDVIPRLLGNGQVSLEIIARNNRLPAGTAGNVRRSPADGRHRDIPPAYDSASLSTFQRVTPGTWTTLGGTAGSTSSSSQGILSSSGASQQNQGELRIRVHLVD